MSTKYKFFPAEFKTLDDKGSVEAIVSVFGNVDKIGDRVIKGAFTKSLAKWKASGDPVPVILSHQWNDPWAHIGAVDELEEVDRGLRAKYTLDIDTNPVAAQIHGLMKRRLLKEHSFGYETVDERRVKDGVNELLELDLIELGPTLKGMNDQTELLAVKSQLKVVAAQETEEAVTWTIQIMTADGKTHPLLLTAPPAVRNEMPDPNVPTIYAVSAKAGRSISSKNEARIRGAVDSLSEVLASLGDADEKAPITDTDEAKAKADESKAIDRSLLELQALILNT